MIRSLQGLCDYFSADGPEQLNKRVYKGTDCGASISVQTPDGAWHHNGQDWSGITEIKAFTIQTIIEGSDVTVDSDPFVLPVDPTEVDSWMTHMETEASARWEDANNPMCECGHRSEEHRWDDDPAHKDIGAVKGFECTTEGCDCKEFKEDESYGDGIDY